MAPAPRLPARRAGFVLVVALALGTMAVVARTRAGGPDQVGWSQDLIAGRRAAATQRKLVLLDFTADWCPACQELHRTTWSDRSVASAIADRCVPVKVDVDAHPDLGRQYRVEYLPTLILTDAQGRELRRSVGYLSPGEFRTWLAGSGGQAGG